MLIFASYKGYKSDSYKLGKRYSLEASFGDYKITVRYYYSDVDHKSTVKYNSFESFFEDWYDIGNNFNDKPPKITEYDE